MHLLQAFYQEYYFMTKRQKLINHLHADPRVKNAKLTDEIKLRLQNMLEARLKEARMESAHKAVARIRELTQCDPTTKQLLLENIHALPHTKKKEDLLESIFGLMLVYNQNDPQSWTLPQLMALWHKIMTGKEIVLAESPSALPSTPRPMKVKNVLDFYFSDDDKPAQEVQQGDNYYEDEEHQGFEIFLLKQVYDNLSQPRIRGILQACNTL